MLPGEQVKRSSSLHKTRRLRLGEGLRHASDAVSATCAGILHTDFTGEAWLDVRSKKHVPAEDETVIGTVIEAHADSYVIDISASLEGKSSRTIFRRRDEAQPSETHGRVSRALSCAQSELWNRGSINVHR